MTRVLAVDLGSVRVGIAVSDASATLAVPLTTVHRSGDRDSEHRAIARLVTEEEVGLVLVGLPRNMDGSLGPAAQAAEAEAAELAAVVGVPVELVDERLTTVGADRLLRGEGRRRRGAPARRKVVDQTAAAVLLQGWLDGAGGRHLRSGG